MLRHRYEVAEGEVLDRVDLTRLHPGDHAGIDPPFHARNPLKRAACQRETAWGRTGRAGGRDRREAQSCAKTHRWRLARKALGQRRRLGRGAAVDDRARLVDVVLALAVRGRAVRRLDRAAPRGRRRARVWRGLTRGGRWRPLRLLRPGGRSRPAFRHVQRPLPMCPDTPVRLEGRKTERRAECTPRGVAERRTIASSTARSADSGGASPSVPSACDQGG